jgi:hypothetical protein
MLCSRVTRLSECVYKMELLFRNLLSIFLILEKICKIISLLSLVKGY